MKNIIIRAANALLVIVLSLFFPLTAFWSDSSIGLSHNPRQCDERSASLRRFSDCESAVHRLAGRCLRCASVAIVASGTAVRHAVRSSGEGNDAQRIGDISGANEEGSRTAAASEDIESARWKPA
jgi:hypothetical protein